MSSVHAAAAEVSNGEIVSPFLRLPPELRLLVYNNIACDVERALPLGRVRIYYHDVDPAILSCCKLVRREAYTLLRHLRLAIPPTLVITLDLHEIPFLLDTPNSRSLGAVVRMLLSGHHYWFSLPSSPSISNMPLGFCDFFRRFEQQLSGLQTEDYVVTSQPDLEAFYRRTLLQMQQTRSLTVLLRLNPHCTQQLRVNDIRRRLPLGRSFGSHDPRLLSLNVAFVVDAEYMSRFGNTVSLLAGGSIRSVSYL
ncbi:hypothetical protein EKO04_003606 [Ascochyta lentis]|uniref:Uncharacterized protein n=1 Tax=Ascochyta lentis TaxID=205686 RepID=A0A8H7MKM2_9PLEO|nr:hypothetical protein EKO04_003606 [Ascochyta lentis]